MSERPQRPVASSIEVFDISQQPSSAARCVAAAAATVAWLALCLQLWLVIEKANTDGTLVSAALWRFFGYFTILTNLLVAIVASAMALKAKNSLRAAPARLAAATAIVMVGIVYSLALRHVWTPTGWQAVADHALHDVTPGAFLIAWLLWPHGGLMWRHGVVAISFPLLYVVYAMARGQIDGWYAYWFLDPSALSFLQLGGNVVLLSATFLAAALSLIALDRWLARRRVKA